MCSSKATTGLVPGSGDTVSILKYSIATLLLCASSVVAGIHTYLAISAILSAAAVPVLSAAISVVAALVALSSTVYLIKSFVSAVNSEREIDPSEKQQQKNNDNAAKMQPVTKVPTAPDTLPVFPLPNGAPTASPPPPPPPPPPLPEGVPPLPSGSSNSSTRSGSANLFAGIRNRSTELKKPNIPDIPKGDARDAFLKEIRQVRKLLTKKKHNDESKRMAKKKPDNNGSDLVAELHKKLRARRKGVKGEKENTANQDTASTPDRSAMSEEKRKGVELKPVEQRLKEGKTQQPPNTASQDIAQILVKAVPTETPDSKKGDKHESGVSGSEWKNEHPTPQTHQPGNKKRSESPDSGNVSDDDWETDPSCVYEPFSTKDIVGPVKRKLLPPETKMNGDVDTSEISFNNARQVFSKTG